MRANLIYWSLFVGLGVLLWVSSATSSRAFQMAVGIAVLCWSAAFVIGFQRRSATMMKRLSIAAAMILVVSADASAQSGRVDPAAWSRVRFGSRLGSSRSFSRFGRSKA